MAISLAIQTRDGFEQAEGSLGDRANLVRRVRATSNEGSGERDRLLGEIVWAYRKGDRQVWGAVLLDLLTPALLKKLKRYSPEEPVVDLEDIRQQLVVELLHAAATMPFPPGADFVERRLVLRAGQGVRRWLSRERRYRAVHLPLQPEIGEEI
jgi:hypothetical protein